MVALGAWCTYKSTTVNQAYHMDSLSCCTHPLHGHVEVLTSPSLFLGWCVLLSKEITADQAYLMDSLPCCTQILQGHLEVLTSTSSYLGRVFVFCLRNKSLLPPPRFKPALVLTGGRHTNKSATAAELVLPVKDNTIV